MTITETYQRLV